MATQTPPLVQETLPNGLRLVTAPIPTARSVTVNVFTGVGSRYETPQINGISHFLEHLFFRGTESRPTSREIAEAIEGVGGYFNAYTSDDRTSYYARVPAKHGERAFDVLSDILLKSRFDPELIDRERGTVIEEINLYNDDPAKQIDQISSSLVWPDQPLGYTILGTKEVIARLSRDDILSYVRDHYVTENMTVVVAGGVERDRAKELALRYFGPVSAGSASVAEPAQAVPGPRVRTVDRPTDQSQLLLAAYAPSLKDDRQFAARVLNAVLGSGASSRLFQRIRDELGLAYMVRSYYEPLIDGGSLVVRAGVTNERSLEAASVVLEELKRLSEEPVESAEFEKAKELVKGGLELRLEDAESLADWLGTQVILKGEFLTPDDVVQALDRVTPVEVQTLAHEMFQRENIQLAAIGPGQSDERLWDVLSDAYGRAGEPGSTGVMGES